MPEHLIEVHKSSNGRVVFDGQPYASIRLPHGSPAEIVEASAESAKSTVGQMLARFGVEQEVTVIHVPDAPTGEELDREMRVAHERLTAGADLPSTADILGDRTA